MKKNIRNKMLFAFGGVCVALLLQFALTLYLQTSVVRSVTYARDVGYAGNELAMSLKHDVSEVAGWLADISATRGLDGLNGKRLLVKTGYEFGAKEWKNSQTQNNGHRRRQNDLFGMGHRPPKGRRIPAIKKCYDFVFFFLDMPSQKK